MAEAYQTAYSGGWYYFLVDDAETNQEAEDVTRRQFSRLYPDKNVTGFTAVVTCLSHHRHSVTIRPV